MAVSPLFEAWLEKPHGVLTFRMTQVFTGHGTCRHCVERPEDTVQHIVEVCPAWAVHRRALVGTIDGGDLSRRALVEAMVRSEEE